MDLGFDKCKELYVICLLMPSRKNSIQGSTPFSTSYAYIRRSRVVLQVYDGTLLAGYLLRFFLFAFLLHFSHLELTNLLHASESSIVAFRFKCHSDSYDIGGCTIVDASRAGSFQCDSATDRGWEQILAWASVLLPRSRQHCDKYAP